MEIHLSDAAPADDDIGELTNGITLYNSFSSRVGGYILGTIRKSEQF